MYTGYSTEGPLVFLAATRDFRSTTGAASCCRRRTRTRRSSRSSSPAATRCSTARCPVATGTDGGIWLSWSPDLVHWGDHRPLLAPGGRGSWESGKIGLGPPPLLDAQPGGSSSTTAFARRPRGAIYRAGLALLDREQPERVLARSPEWVFGPAGAVRARRRRRQRRLPVRLGARRRRRHGADLLRRRRHERRRRDGEPRRRCSPISGV